MSPESSKTLSRNASKRATRQTLPSPQILTKAINQSTRCIQRFNPIRSWFATGYGFRFTSRLGSALFVHTMYYYIV